MDDYLIFTKQSGYTKPTILDDVKYISSNWCMDGTDNIEFHKVTGTKYQFGRDDILKLYRIQYMGDDVILKEIKIQNKIDGNLSCYFAHSWISKDHPDKIRIVKALEEMKIEVIDPFNGEDDLCTKHGEIDYYPNCNYKLGRDIWVKDLGQIREADMFLMWIDSSAPGRFMGTSYEMAYAFNLGKHIQIISDLRHPYMAYVLCDGNRQYNTIEDFENQRRIRWK